MNMDLNTGLDKVSDVSKMLSEYGPTIVILSIFLIVFLIVMILLINNNQKYINQIVKQNDDIFNKLFNSINNSDYDKEDIIEIFTRLNEVFKGECKKITEKTGSSRASIYVFHNGTVASHGLPFFKMTCVSEWTKRNSGFTEQMQKHNNLNLALFGSLIQELYDDGEYVVTCRDNLKDPSINLFMSEKTSSSIFTCVYDSNNRIMAFVNAEFTDCLSEEEVNSALDVMKYSCAKIQPVLEFSSYNR